MSKFSILLTGGTGYIGSHTCVELFNFYQKQSVDFKIVIVDNLSNSTICVIDRIKEILNLQKDDNRIQFHQIDLQHAEKLNEVFQFYNDQNYPIQFVIHFAALKAVGESVQQPLLYYKNNLISTINLLQSMQNFNCKNLIFSSSATVYGINSRNTEDCIMNSVNAYGSTKVCIEYLLRDMCIGFKDLSLISLRYYNPCGAHESGKIGEMPQSYPNNLFPFIEQVVVGKRELLNVFGNDYNTPDGTGVRDYVHVMDLADAHVKAIQKFQTSGYKVYNLGTEKGYSVLNVLDTYSKVIGKQISYKIVGRREGDVPSLIAVSTKAYEELGWKSQRDLYQMCKDSYRFTCMNNSSQES